MRPHPGRVLDEAVVDDGRKGRQRRGRRERIATVARGRGARAGEGLGADDRAGGDDAADRKPFPMPLPTVRMSGTTPEWLHPNQRPVRPNPVIISSAINKAPISLAML